MSAWIRYHNYCMREAHHIAFLNLVVAVTATLAATTAAFSTDENLIHRLLAIGLWWMILVRAVHTSRIRPKQLQEENHEH